MEEPEPFLTSDAPLAAYLHMKGMTLIGKAIADKYDQKRKVFVFMDEPERARFEQEWLDDFGGFWTFWSSYKIVKRSLFND